MRIFNNIDNCINLQNRIIFIWKSVLTGVKNMSDMNKLYSRLVRSNYVINEDSVKKLNNMIDRLPAIQDSFFDVLDSRNVVYIQEHLEFMSNYSQSVIQEIDKLIEWIKNQNTKERIDVTRTSLEILLRLKTTITDFVNEFELH